MKILKIILIALVALAALIAVAGFLILPAVLKSVLPDKISAALHRQAAVEQIQINPFALSATLRGFKLADTDGKTPFVSLGELTVTWSSDIHRPARPDSGGSAADSPTSALPATPTDRTISPI
jgi:uncharacterized protein involved in outer membrane biogenesis